MKRTLFAITLLLLIIGVGIWEQFIIDGVFKDFKASLVNIESNVDDTAYAIDETEKLIAWWDEKRETFEALTNHDEIKDIRIKLAELNAYLKVGDAKMAHVQAQSLIATCENVPHLLALHYEHVL